MFVQVRKMTITEGFSEQVAGRFSKPGIIEEQEGFIGKEVLVKKVRRGEEEVLVLIRWESEAHWKQWEKSDAHIAGHKEKRQQSKPEFMLNVEVGKYELFSTAKAEGEEK